MRGGWTTWLCGGSTVWAGGRGIQRWRLEDTDRFERMGAGVGAKAGAGRVWVLDTARERSVGRYVLERNIMKTKRTRRQRQSRSVRSMGCDARRLLYSYSPTCMQNHGRVRDRRAATASSRCRDELRSTANHGPWTMTYKTSAKRDVSALHGAQEPRVGERVGERVA